MRLSEDYLFGLMAVVGVVVVAAIVVALPTEGDRVNRSCSDRGGLMVKTVNKGYVCLRAEVVDLDDR